MQLRPIRIKVSKRFIRDFKHLAKECFPKEAFCYLLGTDIGDTVEIEDMFVPNDLDEWTTPVETLLSPTWLPAARKKAREHGLVVVGDLHSHPYLKHETVFCKPEPVPSKTDFECGLSQITGICAVWETKSNKLLSTIKFYGPMFPVYEDIV